MRVTTKHQRDMATAYARVVGATRCVVEPLASAAHQLRGMGGCRACKDFDTNPQARQVEDAVEVLRRALDHFDRVGASATEAKGEAEECDCNEGFILARAPPRPGAHHHAEQAQTGRLRSLRAPWREPGRTP